MARAGLRRGELCGLRRSDVHLLACSRRLGARSPALACMWSAAATTTGTRNSRKRAQPSARTRRTQHHEPARRD